MGAGPKERGLSRKHFMEQCDASLRRLGLDYIDLYQCHHFDPEVPMEETLYALDDWLKQGKILYAGVSEWSTVQIEIAADSRAANNTSNFVINSYFQRLFKIIDPPEKSPILCLSIHMGGKTII